MSTTPPSCGPPVTYGVCGGRPSTRRYMRGPNGRSFGDSPINDVLCITGGSTPKSAGKAVHASTSGSLTKSCDDSTLQPHVVPVVLGLNVPSVTTTCGQDSGLGSTHPLSTQIFSSASLLCLLPLELRWVGHLFRMPSNRLNQSEINQSINQKGLK